MENVADKFLKNNLHVVRHRWYDKTTLDNVQFENLPR